MFIEDRIEQIAFQLQEELENTREELENTREQLKAVQDENAKLKETIDRCHKADMEKRRVILDNNEKIAKLEATIKMLENDRKEGLKACCDCSHKFQDRIKGLKDEVRKLNEEKQQAGDNLRNRVKDLEVEIDQLKSNSSTVSYSELLAIHTADVETINKLNIKARDLNGTISTLLERVSTYDKENQELKKKVQDLNDFIQRI